MPKIKQKQYRLRIPSQTENLEMIREFVSNIAQKVGFNADESNKIELAVDEACTNVIEHAYHKSQTKDIDVAVKIDYQKLTVVVTDSGDTFKANNVDMLDMQSYLAELRVGGLGIYLMKTLMDEVDYKSGSDGRNEVHMVKYLLNEEKKSVQ